MRGSGPASQRRLGGVHIDALDLTGSVVISYGEGGVGGHGQLASLNDGQLSSSAGAAAARGKEAVLERRNRRRQSNQSGSSPDQRQPKATAIDLFIFNTPLLIVYFSFPARCASPCHQGTGVVCCTNKKSSVVQKSEQMKPLLKTVYTYSGPFSMYIHFARYFRLSITFCR